MTGLMTFLFIGVLLCTLRSVIRSFVRSAPSGDRQHDRLKGEDMVLDPECRTYVPKGRAIARRINDEDLFFCSEACARQYAEKQRG